MTTARELHDSYAEKGIMLWMGDPSAKQIILRALDLLARVEESEDELVRMCEAASRDERLADGMLYRKAAAALVALKAERDKLKDNAEAMANRIEWYAEEGWVNGDIPEAKSYRRDFPKDAP